MVLGWVLSGQAAKPAREGLPTDWSHHHLIFSQPATFEKISQITRDPRYWQQWYRQNARPLLADAAASSDFRIMNPRAGHNSAGAWSEFLGSGASVGAGNYPAKYSFEITGANCDSAAQPDYVVFNTGLSGSTTQASVVAFDNLYSGCSGTVPSVYWAYNTGGQILTSPALSLDGTQVAFVQTNASLEGTLVLLKWAPTGGTVDSPVTLTAVANGAYRNCTAPCMTTIILQDGLGVPTDDRTSSVFPDYGRDVIWVGGALGWLHQITGVFHGTPTEVTNGGFPIQLGLGNSLSSPVYDSASNNVFVGDYGGIFYQVSSTGVITASGEVDFGAGLVAGPVVDSTAEKIYVFSSSDGSTNCTGGVPCAAVFQFSPNFAPGTTGTEAVVGISQFGPPNPNPLYEGGFDSTYQASVNATGNLYVCGNTAGTPILYQIPISAGMMGTPLSGPVLTSATTGCSPVTDVPNPAAIAGTASSEWIFVSAQNSASGNNCASGGCLMNYTVQPWQPATTYAKGQEILDSNFHIEVVRTPGMSGTNAPTWGTAINDSTTDNIVRWTNQGPNHASHPAWQANNTYLLNAEILDSNGNVEWASNHATSGGSTPSWSTTIGGTTADGTVSWRNVGPVATVSTAAAGGTSGIIMDNIVGSGTLAGASQVYFSTQGNQTCSTSGGSGGCATQASQSALQ